MDLFHGGIPGGDDCAAAGTPGGCGHLIAGTTRVWETITGGNASMSGTWYVTNNPTTQDMTKGTLGNRSYINQVKYSPKWSSDAIAGTNDGNVWIGFNLGTGSQSQANWVNVTGSNAVLPNRPILGIALDPDVGDRRPPAGYAAVGGFNANTPTTRATSSRSPARRTARPSPGRTRRATCPTSRSTRSSSTRTCPRRSSPARIGASTARTTSRPRRRPGSASATGCRTRWSGISRSIAARRRCPPGRGAAAPTSSRCRVLGRRRHHHHHHLRHRPRRHHLRHLRLRRLRHHHLRLRRHPRRLRRLRRHHHHHHHPRHLRASHRARFRTCSARR